MQTRSVPLQVPFSVQFLTTEPFPSNPSLQEKVHTVLYIICVALHPNSWPLVGGDKFEHVTTRNKSNNKRGWFARQLSHEPVISSEMASVIRAIVD